MIAEVLHLTGHRPGEGSVTLTALTSPSDSWSDLFPLSGVFLEGDSVKSRILWSVGLLFGLGLMALGLFGSGQTSDKVLCGSDEMRPGQTCSTTRYGQTSDETYEEKRQAAVDDANSFQNGGRWVTFGIGAGVAALCGWRLIVALRRRPAQGAGQGVQSPPGQQPGFAQQPAFAPWGNPAPQDFAPQPGYPQHPGFFAPQGVQQPPPPGYQQQRPRG